MAEQGARSGRSVTRSALSLYASTGAQAMKDMSVLNIANALPAVLAPATMASPLSLRVGLLECFLHL